MARTFVVVEEDNSGYAALVGVALVVGFLIFAGSLIDNILHHSHKYALVHVLAAKFYYWTTLVPIMGIPLVWNYVGSLTPWGNLNLVLSIIAVPLYCIAAFVLLVMVLALPKAKIEKWNPVIAYVLPAILSLSWAALEWLFA